MINFWWRDGEPPLLTPLNALYHAVITMKDLPPNELAAWRNMFDHYIFGDNGDPAEHLPEGGARAPRQAHAGAGRAGEKAVDRRALAADFAFHFRSALP